MTTWVEFMKQPHAGPALPRAVLDDLTCTACRSHEATTMLIDRMCVESRMQKWKYDNLPVCRARS